MDIYRESVIKFYLLTSLKIVKPRVDSGMWDKNRMVSKKNLSLKEGIGIGK